MPLKEINVLVDRDPVPTSKISDGNGHLYVASASP